MKDMLRQGCGLGCQTETENKTKTWNSSQCARKLP